MISILCCIPSFFPFPQSSLLFPMGCLLIWQISHFNCRHLFTITVIIIITVMLPIIKSVITTSRDLGQYVNRWWLLGPNARSGSGSSYKFNTQPRVFMRIWDVAGTLYRDISLLPLHYFVAGTFIQKHHSLANTLLCYWYRISWKYLLSVSQNYV